MTEGSSPTLDPVDKSPEDTPPLDVPPREGNSPTLDLVDKSPEDFPPLDVLRRDEQLPCNLVKQQELKVVYEVGFRKPPTSGYFPKGVSGNPNGRPRGSTNKYSRRRLNEIVLAETEREVAIYEGGRTVVISAAEAMLRALIKSSRKGDTRAAKLVMDAMYIAEKDEAVEQEKDYMFAKLYQAHGLRELAKKPGTFTLIPDPNEIRFDERRRLAIFEGPRNAEEEGDLEEQKFEEMANPRGLRGGKRDNAIGNFLAEHERETGVKLRDGWPDLLIPDLPNIDD